MSTRRGPPSHPTVDLDGLARNVVGVFRCQEHNDLWSWSCPRAGVLFMRTIVFVDGQNQIRFGDSTIEYEVRRSQRRKKTIQITVDGSGVQVAAPSATLDTDLRAVVRKRAPWILTHTKGDLLEAAPKRFVSGETLPYLGRNVRMVVAESDVPVPQIRFDHWRFQVAVPQGLKGEERYERVRRAVVEWYRGRAADREQSSVDLW